MKSTMRFAALAASILLAVAGVACSSDDDDSNKNKPGSGDGGKGGEAGNDETDSGTEDDAETPDDDAETPADLCAAEDDDSDCETCLKANCCDEGKACYDIEACKEALGDYQSCLDEATDTLSDCSDTFGQAANADPAGGEAASDFGACAAEKCADKCGKQES